MIDQNKGDKMSIDFNDIDTVIDTLEVLTDLDILRSAAISLAKLVNLETEKTKLYGEMIELYKERMNHLTVALEKATEVLQMLKANPELIKSL